MNGRWRLLLAVLATLLVAQLDTPGVLSTAVMLALAVFAVQLAARPKQVGRLIRRWLQINVLTLLVWLTLPWQWDDGWHLSRSGLELAQLISLRSNAIALLCLGLIGHLNALQIARAAAELGLPARLSNLLLLTVRYLDVMVASKRRVTMAMQARGFAPAVSRAGLSGIAAQVSLILQDALYQAQQVERAMLARGFVADRALAAAWMPGMGIWVLLACMLSIMLGTCL